MVRVCREAVRLFDGVQWAGVTVCFDGPPLTVASTDARVLVVDMLQYAVAGGPCLLAMRTATAVAVTAADMEHRWPDQSRAAMVLEVQSVMAAPMMANTRVIGALNLYSPAVEVPLPDPNLFTVLTQCAGRGLADFCNGHPAPIAGRVLSQATADSATVQKAVEVLMRVYGFAADYAWAVLMDLAKDWGRTVGD